MLYYPHKQVRSVLLRTAEFIQTAVLAQGVSTVLLFGDTAQSYGITYEYITGMVASYTTPQNSFTYSYDEFDRLTHK